MYNALHDDNLRKNLEDKFLYEDDLSALYLMLELIQRENETQACKPVYIVNNKISKMLEHHLSYRRDKYNIIKAIMGLIEDDVNKLELTYYVQAYSIGFNEKYYCDQLEYFLLRHFPASSIRDFLETNKKNSEIILDKTVDRIISNIKKDYEIFESQDTVINNYCDVILKDKVLRLNKSLDRQLVLKTINQKTYISEERQLNPWQIDNLYKKIVQQLKLQSKRSSDDAIWNGLSDRLSLRYKS